MLRVEGLPLVRVPAITAAQMAEVDRAAVEEYGIHLEMLMENASRAIALAARVCLGGSVAGRRIVALAGPGNNGGDALGATRHLLNWGAAARAGIAVAPERLRPLPLVQYRALAAIGAEPAAGVDRAALSSADLILDGLLGYSVTGPARGNIAAFIDAANASGAPILAIDIPSGLDPDTGRPPGPSIVAAATVTLGLPKVGLLADAARREVGRLLLADIAVPPVAYERFGVDARGIFADGELVRVEI
ncbi:MAG: NAD(P)H-hydrate epimerase [Chloroflexi bacterium 13_1_40CM_4_68_4]|nr:MAG: NAD(P)H-hydrate epimerase [Chloroflexi bacterium 13_1_40CM_4_68_4]